MKRSCLLSAFILLALSILLLSGCSSHSPDEGADEPKAVTLGVWKNDALLPTVNAFNAQQEQFQIRLVIYDSLELMQTELMAGKYCDLYLLEMDNSAMAAKSLFVDFMPRVEETLKNTENEVVPELLDAMTVNGALMQIPYSFSIGTCMGLQQYFDGHGISLEDAKQALNDHARPIFPEEWKLKARNIASKVSSVSGIFFVDRSKEEVQFQKSEFGVSEILDGRMGCSAITGYRFRSCLVDTDVHRRPGRASGRGLCIYRLSDAGKYARRFVFFVWNGVQHHIRLKKC